MPRYRLTVEYDGAGHVGWQRQKNGPSVQAALEAAIHAFCAEHAIVHGAGRTDAGVHARGQVCHVDLVREVAGNTLRDALNAHLRPKPIVVIAAGAAPPAFHARFSATARCYRYRILNRRAPPALERGRVWWIAPPLDRAAMTAAAAHLVGRRDFTSFRASQCQAPSPVRTLDRLDISAAGEEIIVTAQARSFLHNQVRIMVGTLARVGLGKTAPAAIAAMLSARDRAAAGPTAPARGLCLMAVSYGASSDDAQPAPSHELE